MLPFIALSSPQVIEMAMSDKKDKLFPMLEKLGISKKMKSDDREKSGKPLMKCIMQAWLPANTALLEMIVYHLPSPARVIAQLHLHLHTHTHTHNEWEKATVEKLKIVDL